MKSVQLHQVDSIETLCLLLNAHGYPNPLAKLTSDTRQIVPGDVWCALTVNGADGRQYIEQALQAGARFLIIESDGYVSIARELGLVVAQPNSENASCPILVTVPNLANQLGDLANRWYQRDLAKLHPIGITGTNGKTTTCLWISHALRTMGKRVVSIGTLGVGTETGYVPTGYTTPDALLLHSVLAKMVDNQYNQLVMEVSSHALDQGRVVGVPYEVAILTNFSQDHLDYHQTTQHYWEAKEKLFKGKNLKFVVLNRYEKKSLDVLATIDAAVHVIAYGVCPAFDDNNTKLDAIWNRNDRDQLVLASSVQTMAQGVAFELQLVKNRSIQWQRRLELPIVGQYNLENWLTAVATLLTIYPIDEVVEVLKKITQVPGRMEVINPESTVNEPLVIVDFAHTPDAVAKALHALKPMVQMRGGELWCVIGCGGNRDASKRPLMANRAMAVADQLILTSDNPRNENPETIIQQMVSGLRAADKYQVKVDREAAIEMAIMQAKAVDVILIAGKGHETTQEIQGQKYAFSDQLVAQQGLEKRRGALSAIN